ncbi:MAG: S4 domain-containing protein [Lawsonibacter sp.]
MALERLDKLLASTGRWSRQEVKDLVRQGRVQVRWIVPAAARRRSANPRETETDRWMGRVVDCAPFVYLHAPQAGGSAVRHGGPPAADGAGPAARASAPPGAVSRGAAGQGHRGAAPAHQ